MYCVPDTHLEVKCGVHAEINNCFSASVADNKLQKNNGCTHVVVVKVYS